MNLIASKNQLPNLHANSLQSYLDSIQQLPILSVQEESALFQQFHQEDDLEAARQLVMSHLRYVAYIARGYTGYGLPLEDLIQQGNLGLMKSVKRFDPAHGVRLVSFAVHWIKAEIHEFILKNWKIVKVATTKAQRKLFFNLRKSKQRLGWFNAEEVQQVASDLGVKPNEVLEMEARLANQDESFEPLTLEDDDYVASPSAYLNNGEADDPAWRAAEEEASQTQADNLTQALTALDSRSRDIVESRWLQAEKVSLKVLAEKYGVSLERIRQIEKKAFASMQPYLAKLA